MKSTGIVRRIDQLGRIVLPKELRNTLNITGGDLVEIFVEGESVIFQKYKREEACIISGEVSRENLRLPNGLVISRKAAEQLLNEIAIKSK